MALLTSPGFATVTGTSTSPSTSTSTHPRLVRRRTEHHPQAMGWSKDDTLFVALLLAAVLMCALVPLALL